VPLMKPSRRAFWVFVLVAFGAICPPLAPEAKEKVEIVPESLPKILREGAASLEQEISALKNRLEMAQQDVKDTDKELLQLRAQVATLKASLAVRELNLKQTQEAQETLTSKAQILPERIKQVQQQRSELALQETARAEAFQALRVEIGRLEAVKHPIWRQPEVRQSYLRFQQLAQQYTAATARLGELLDKRLKLLEEEAHLLEDTRNQLKGYLEEVWKAELLKRQAPVSLKKRWTQTWTALRELPERLRQYIGQLWSSEELPSLVLAKAAPLVGLLGLLFLLLWGARRLRLALLPGLTSWQAVEEERGLRVVMEVAIVLLSHLYHLSLFLWVLLAVWILGFGNTRGGSLLVTALAVWVALKMGFRMVQAIFQGKDINGLLPLDQGTARFYRRQLKCLLLFVLLFGVLGLRTASLLELEPQSRQVLGELFQVGLLIWAIWLLRPKRLDPLRLELPGPAWIRKRWFFQGLRALVLLVLGAILLFSLLGFQNLSAYVAEGGALSGLVVVLFWLVWQGLATILRFVLHPDLGWLGQKYPSIRDRLHRFYPTVKRTTAVLLTVLGTLVILQLWGLEAGDMARYLTWLNRGPSLGFLQLTPVNLMLAGLTVYVGLWFSRFLKSLLETRFYPRTDWDQGIRYTISTTSHYAILLLAGIMALNFLGFPLTNLALVAGALGVGIGFGLQNIVNNFVSGLILLFERPIKVGDLLVIDGHWGRVKEIRVRSTTFETVDQAVIIIPNSELLAHKIINWTKYGKRPSRLTLEVGVSYGADVHLVTRVLHDLCLANPRVLKEPPPQIYFQAFGDSALTFIVRVFVKSPEPRERNAVTHELNTAIHAAFREHGIEIPFPQREVHLKTWPTSSPPPVLLSGGME